MVAIYVVSVEAAAGKTSVCAGLGGYFQGEEKKVGYLRPESGDGDIAFMKHILGADNVESSDGRDVVLVEAGLGADEHDALSRDTYGAAREMNAKVIAVETYAGAAPAYTESYKGFGESLLGVVINKVPQSQLARVKEEAAKKLGAAGLKLLGAVPEDRGLLAITVGELAESLQGKILNNEDKTAELVENYMLGAMVVDSGPSYFGRKVNKAAVIRQNRPDMQLAALETSMRCLVLSGSGEPPMYSVLEKAENRGLPIIATDAATSEIITAIEAALRESRFHQEKKLPKLAEMMKNHLELQAIG